MEKVDEARLETDIGYRFEYLSKFIGFGAEDIDAIHGAAPLLAPLVPALVDAVYDKLASFESTWRHFVPRQAGYDGAVPASLAELTMDHEQIQFRKAHLAKYLTRLVSDPYDDKLVKYLDLVGKMHTPKAGSEELDIPLVQMNALMGFVADAFNATILSADLNKETQAKTIRAFSKLLWIQNDFIVRHYAAS